MHVSQIDKFSDTQFDAFYDVDRAAHTFERPYNFPWSRDSLKTLVRAGDPAEKEELWAVFEGEEVVAAGWLWLPLLDNVSQAWIGVGVLPERRRNGYGTALLQAITRSATEQDRTVFLLDAGYPLDAGDDHPYRLFAEAHGYSLASTEVARILDLPVSQALLEELAEEASPHHTAYEVRHYVGSLPMELIPSYCHLHNQLGHDAPSGDIEFEEETITPEMWLERHDKLTKAGRTRSTVVAVERATGEVVAYTDLMVPRDDEPDVVYQWGTLVGRDHRGHRLGLAVKVRNLVEIQRLYPERKIVQTGNSVANPWMVSINERLGFRPVETLAEFQRKVG